MNESQGQPHDPPKSQEYQNFEAGLRQVLSVSKEELDRRVKAEKQAGKKKARKETP